MAENFFHILKMELINENIYNTRRARMAIFYYIEIF